MVDPNLAHRRGMHGKVFTATAGNRVLSVRLNSKGTEICERNFGAVKGIVPGVYPA